MTFHSFCIYKHPNPLFSSLLFSFFFVIQICSSLSVPARHSFIVQQQTLRYYLSRPLPSAYCRHKKKRHQNRHHRLMLPKLRKSLQKNEKRVSPPTLTQKSPLAIEAPKAVIRALYDYVQRSSQELSFNKGDFFHVVGNENDHDW